MSLLPSLSTLALVLGTLTTAGGVTGYVRAGSVPSLAAGGGVGLLFLLGGYRLHARASYGLELALLASVVLAGSSFPRAVRTGFKPLPTGLSVLAAVGLVRFGWAYVNKRAV